MVRARRRIRRAPRRRVIPSIKRLIRKKDVGTIIRTSPDPPSFSMAPWNKCTICLSVTGTYNIDFDVLYYKLTVQFGWGSGTSADPKFPKMSDGKEDLRILIRPLAVRVWGISGKPLAIRACDAIGNRKAIKTVSDYGSKNHYSHVGYRFGDVMEQDAEMTRDKSVICGILQEKTATSLVYVDVLWRAGGDVIPAIVWNEALLKANNNELTLDSMSIS